MYGCIWIQPTCPAAETALCGKTLTFGANGVWEVDWVCTVSRQAKTLQLFRGVVAPQLCRREAAQSCARLRLHPTPRGPELSLPGVFCYGKVCAWPHFCRAAVPCMPGARTRPLGRVHGVSAWTRRCLMWAEVVAVLPVCASLPWRVERSASRVFTFSLAFCTADCTSSVWVDG